mgnify:CR=1 FL=1
MKLATVIVFVLTCLLIAGGRQLSLLPIGRPAWALLGALGMVAIGALTPAQSFAAVDHDTILLLFSMMLLTVYLDRAGFFDASAALLLGLCRTPWQLLATISLLAAVLSAVLVNDTVCVFLTPLVVATCRRAGLPLGPYLIAVATSANIGSACTLVGNPQNMIIGSLSGLPFLHFFARALPATLAGLLVNLGLLWLYYGRRLPRTPLDRPALPAHFHGRRLLFKSLVLVGVVGGFIAGLHMGYVGLAGVLVLVLADRRDTREAFSRVDWPLLIFFCGLFIVVGGFATTGLAEQTWRAAAPGMDLRTASGTLLFSALMVAGSNIVSNVPLVMLTGPHLAELGGGSGAWILLAYTTTVAGNLTLLGSVANLIVAEQARPHYSLGFREYLKFGLVSTVAVLAVGVPLLVLSERLAG